VAAHLAADPTLVPLVAARPGLRVPGSVDGFELAMGGFTPARLRARAERWRPWRAYAAQHLWASLSRPGNAGGASG
jgi:3-methyladenine DNA glycosylase/8-oxoguanine DNA glycosylase